MAEVATNGPEMLGQRKEMFVLSTQFEVSKLITIKLNTLMNVVIQEKN